MRKLNLWTMSLFFSSNNVKKVNNKFKREFKKIRNFKES